MTTDLNRRAFLGRTGLSLGSVAFAALGAGRKTERWPGVVRPLHHAAKVKRVIYLYMSGGPSHLETFDANKPELVKLDGQLMPTSYTQGQSIAQLQNQSSPVYGRSFRLKNLAKAARR